MSAPVIQLRSVQVTLQLLNDAILVNGGLIPFSRFMEISLFGPQGYYASAQARIGTMGHFTTSPELSPRFGASIGRQLAHTWEAMGRPKPFEIVEMGAGTGSLAEGLLDDARLTNPAFFSALDYQILECGDLIGIQQKKLRGYHDESSPTVSWIRGSALDLQVGQINGAFISNELVDTFPVEIVKLRNGRVMQMYITDSKRRKFQPTWREASLEVRYYLDRFRIRLREGVEEPVSLNAVRFQRALCASLRRGVILTIDYGKAGQVGDTGRRALRAYGPDLDELVHADRMKRAFSWPSQLDVTTSVNFAPLLQVAEQSGLRVVYNGSQGGFLRGCGILSFSGGDEVGMPARDRHLIADWDWGVYHAQFLAKDVPNLTMSCRTTPRVRKPAAPPVLSV